MRAATFLAALPATLAAAASYPSQFGVDLVFPRHNEVYKRVFPLPVVLALHGAPSTWPTDLSIKLELMRALVKSDPATTFETVYVNTTTDLVGRLPGDEETYFAVVGMLEAVGSPRENTFLRYEVSFTQDCPEGSEAAEVMADDFDLENANSQGGSLYFKLDDDKGSEPDIVGDKDACAYHVATVLMEEKVEDKCFLLGTPDYEALHEKCRTVLPEGFQEEVMAKVEAIGKCANETKPTREHDAFCNSMAFLADEGEDAEEAKGKTGGKGGKGGSGGGDDDDEDDEDSAAVSLSGGVFGLAGSAALLVPLVASLAW